MKRWNSLACAGVAVAAVACASLQPEHAVALEQGAVSLAMQLGTPDADAGAADIELAPTPSSHRP